MQWLSKLLGLLLAIAAALTVQAWVLNQTIWNSPYVLDQMHNAKLATQLSTVLPEVAVQVTGESEETRLAMKEVLTPNYIQSQLDALTPQMIAYLRGTGEQPVLDLRELEARITNAGLPIPPKLESTIQNPTNVSAGNFDSILKTASSKGNQVLWLGPLVCVVLIGIIFVIMRHRRWSTLAGSFALSAVFLGILGALAYSPPQLISSALDTSAAKLLTPIVKPLADHIAQDQARALWMAAIASLGIAIILAIVHLVAKTFHRKEKKHKGPLAV
jgi:hypothetical protein